MNIAMGNTIKVSRTVVPKNMDNREILQVGACYVEEGFRECEGGVDNNMDGY